MSGVTLILAVLLSIGMTSLLLAGVIALLRRFALAQEGPGASTIQDRMLARNSRPKVRPCTAIENTTTI